MASQRRRWGVGVLLRVIGGREGGYAFRGASCSGGPERRTRAAKGLGCGQSSWSVVAVLSSQEERAGPAQSELGHGPPRKEVRYGPHRGRIENGLGASSQKLWSAPRREGWASFRA